MSRKRYTRLPLSIDAESIPKNFNESTGTNTESWSSWIDSDGINDKPSKISPVPDMQIYSVKDVEDIK